MSISRYELLRAFVTSREKTTAVGIRLQGRESLLITTIEEITGRSQEDTIVQLTPETIYGERIENRFVEIDKIVGVVNLRIGFNDPFYVYLRSLRNNIRNIRQEAGLEKALQ